MQKQERGQKSVFHSLQHFAVLLQKNENKTKTHLGNLVTRRDIALLALEERDNVVDGLLRPAAEVHWVASYHIPESSLFHC